MKPERNIVGQEDSDSFLLTLLIGTAKLMRIHSNYLKPPARLSHLPFIHDTDLSSIHPTCSIMLTIWTTVTTLALLLNPIHAFTNEEYLAGKVEGFTGGDYTHNGDSLISTFCFCAQPTPVPHKDSEGNWFQFEYYNTHTNTTYILQHLCLAGPDSLNTCLAPRDEDGDPEDGQFLNICRTWWRHKEPWPRWDDPKQLCYEQSSRFDEWREARLPSKDLLRWDGQKRRLHSEGGQEPVLRDTKEAEDKCDALCNQHIHMPALRDNIRNQCHIVVYTDLDDMCPDCE